MQNALTRLVPSGALVSQQVNVSSDEIVIRLISTQRIADSKLADVRRDLMRRTGRAVELSVEAVASKRDLADLMERLSRHSAVVVKEKTVGEMQQELFDKVRPAIQEIWPSSKAPIQYLDVVLGTAGTSIDLNYGGSQNLSDETISMVLQALRTKLGIPDLTLQAQRISPPGAAGGPNRAPRRRRRGPRR